MEQPVLWRRRSFPLRWVGIGVELPSDALTPELSCSAASIFASRAAASLSFKGLAPGCNNLSHRRFNVEAAASSTPRIQQGQARPRLGEFLFQLELGGLGLDLELLELVGTALSCVSSFLCGLGPLERIGQPAAASPGGWCPRRAQSGLYDPPAATPVAPWSLLTRRLSDRGPTGAVRVGGSSSN